VASTVIHTAAVWQPEFTVTALLAMGAEYPDATPAWTSKAYVSPAVSPGIQTLLHNGDVQVT
jgi:hypothetical protein